jgi:hypothetical protein
MTHNTEQTLPNIFWFVHNNVTYRAVKNGSSFEMRVYDPILGLKSTCSSYSFCETLRHVTSGVWKTLPDPRIPELKPFYRIKTARGETWIYGGLNIVDTNHSPTDIMLYRNGTYSVYTSVDNLLEHAVSIYHAPSNKEMLNPNATGVEIWRNTTMEQDIMLVELQQAEQKVCSIRSQLEATGYPKAMIDSKLASGRERNHL